MKLPKVWGGNGVGRRKGVACILGTAIFTLAPALQMLGGRPGTKDGEGVTAILNRMPMEATFY